MGREIPEDLAAEPVETGPDKPAHEIEVVTDYLMTTEEALSSRATTEDMDGMAPGEGTPREERDKLKDAEEVEPDFEDPESRVERLHDEMWKARKAGRQGLS